MVKRTSRGTPSDDVARVYAELRKKHIGGRTVQVIAKVMRTAFDAAIRREKYPHAVNPWRIVPVPRHVYKEARVLTATGSAAISGRGSRGQV
jgi:hypothetical protein